MNQNEPQMTWNNFFWLFWNILLLLFTGFGLDVSLLVSLVIYHVKELSFKSYGTKWFLNEPKITKKMSFWILIILKFLSLVFSGFASEWKFIWLIVFLFKSSILKILCHRLWPKMLSAQITGFLKQLCLWDYRKWLNKRPGGILEIWTY